MRNAAAAAGWCARRAKVLSGGVLLLALAAVPAVSADAPGKSIGGIRVETSVADKVGVFFSLSGPFTPKCFSLVGDDRKLVCDFVDTAMAPEIGTLIDVGHDMLFRIRIGRHFDPVRKTRVVLDLDRAKNYSVDMLFVKGKNEFVLVIEPMKEKAKE